MTGDQIAYGIAGAGESPATSHLIYGEEEWIIKTRLYY